jgi:hypothetical protein
MRMRKYKARQCRKILGRQRDRFDSGTHFADFFLTMALDDFGFVLVEPSVLIAPLCQPAAAHLAWRAAPDYRAGSPVG